MTGTSYDTYLLEPFFLATETKHHSPALPIGTLVSGCCPQALHRGSEDGPVPPALLRLASAAALQARGMSQYTVLEPVQILAEGGCLVGRSSAVIVERLTI